MTSRQESLAALLVPFLSEPLKLKVHRAVLCTFIVEVGNDADVDVVLARLGDLQNLRTPLTYERGVGASEIGSHKPQVHVYYHTPGGAVIQG